MLLTTRNAEECIRTMTSDPSKTEFVEFSCLYPALEPSYMEWEKDSKLFWFFYDLFDKYPFAPMIAAILYGVGIHAGRKYMEDRKPFQWRKAMALWNLFLSIYSFMAMVRVFPPLLHSFTSLSLRENLCQVQQRVETFYGLGSTGFWVQSFIWSKFLELFDTLFIIVHKKPLIFLHWYHHITVLLFTWDAYVSRAACGPLFISMNAAVHFVMYGYYFLMTIRMKPKWLNPIFLTVSQILQMVVGVSSMLVTAYLHFFDSTEESPCHGSRRTLIAALIMYGSYLFLFLKFFVERYFKTTIRARYSKKVN